MQVGRFFPSWSDALDAKLRVLDEGSPVAWRRIGRINRARYPTEAVDLLRDVEITAGHCQPAHGS